MDYSDNRVNHWRRDERSKAERTKRRYDDAMARARRILGQPQVYRSTDDSSSEDDAFDFVLSTSAPDRYDNVVNLRGLDLESFLLNPICFWNHDQSFPIGFWQDTRIAGDELHARLELLPEGTTAKVDEIRKLVVAGVLRAASVGLRPIETERRPGSKNGGRDFLKSELVEASLVPIGAHPSALRAITGHPPAVRPPRILEAEGGVRFVSPTAKGDF
jgi:hypothetical protein